MRGKLIALGGLLALTGLTVEGCGDDSRRNRVTNSSAAAATSSTSSTPSSTTTTSTTTTSTTTPAATATSSGSFSVLTYNVAGLPQGISSSNPIVNTPQISPLLNRYDVVLAQEDFTYHAHLMSSTTHPYQSIPLQATAALMNDGLNRFSIYPFTNFARTQWSQCHGFVNAANDCLAMKGFSFARHEVAPGVTVDVYNLHADAGGSTGDEQARTIQFAQLSQFIASVSQGQPLIVAGDTNLKRSRAADAQTVADFLGTSQLTEVADQLGFPDRIDRVMYRNSNHLTLTPTLYRIADEFIDAQGNDLSDHEGIHVDFDWSFTP